MGVLSQDELPRFTVAANMLAMAVKSSAGDAVDYMGSMYHQFDSVAEKMGRVPFAEQLASKTDYLAQAFGTHMQTIADLMAGARGVGANYGVSMDERGAGDAGKILGTEASSSYEAFYKVAEDGAKQLGLSFVNSAGQMLSLSEMLTQLQRRYGASIEGNLKAQAELDKAFGDGANVIKQLYGNTDVLNRHIHALGSNDGLKRARDMAEKMIVPWDRLTAIWTAIRIAMGRTLLLVLTPFINKMADGGQKLARWLTLFPHIARVVGYTVLAFLSLAGAGAVVNIAMGVSAFVMVGLKGLWSALTAIVKLHVAALWLYHKEVLAWAAVMRMMRGVLPP
ncbi:phage tail tape measure protein [Sodalis glossinidius]|uniref:phage tail tape measure protein n=1 Tax=Sodalis glossinidius TaxID=63612 RepID=UPI0002DE30A9|nr:phage tail tape measure protein [Sodalis glossinidius]